VHGTSVFGAHAAACADGALSDAARAPKHPAVVAGKAIVFARHDVRVGDTRPWVDTGEPVADVPHPGERIGAGRPVCTVFAEAADVGACRALLERRAEWVYGEIARWAGA
jgi:predicted ATP-grasp superfamily ATP-dependent carboligase